MAPVVYQGVNGGGGNLFQGQKFFLIQRVPQRNRFIEDIKSNGGFVVTLEKDADILIADRARSKFAPPNSVSWEYLEQSVKNGQLADLETYRIHDTVGTQRPVGSKKLTRTPFTHEDDKELLIWVTKAQRRGLYTKGNDIYDQLEAINPRHTSQSWRDRWVKYVSHQPQPEIDIDDTPEPVKRMADKSHIKTVHTAVPSRATSQARGPTAAPNTSRTTKHSSSPKFQAHIPPDLPKGGLPFTEEDIEIMESEYVDIIRLDLAQLVDAWEAFAERHGRHTASEWCSYYHDVFKPMKDKESKMDTRKGKGKAATNQTVVSAAEIHSTPSRVASSSRSPADTKDAVSTAKATFLEDLKELAHITGRKIELRYTIDGSELQLYDLWRVVNKMEFGGFKKVDKANRWLQVATKLGINTYKHVTAHTTLRQLYHNTLIDLDTLCALRKKDGETSGHSTPASSAKVVAAGTVIETHAQKPTDVFPTEVLPTEVLPTEVLPTEVLPTEVPPTDEDPSRIQPAEISPQEIAYNKVAVQRIRQSLGHGELAFLQSLEEFAQDVMRMSIDLKPTVSGHKISLYDLWTASLPLLDNFDLVENEEVWDSIASKLGFDPSKHPSAPGELRDICDNILADYYEFFKLREIEKAKQQALPQHSKDQEQFKDDPEAYTDDDLDHPSSALKTPRPTAQKRTHNQESMSPVMESPLGHNKRPRTSKGKEREMEIPATPENIYNSHINSEPLLPDNQKAFRSTEFIKTRHIHFSPPVPPEEIESSPSRQLWSESKIDHTPPSQVNIEEESTQSQTDSQDANKELDDFFTRFAEKGFSNEIIQEMMMITTMDPKLAESLLLDHANGLEIPNDVAGVWTKEDDDGVKSSRQSGEYKRVLKKHGKIRCLVRKDFLNDFEEGQANLASGI